MKRYFIVKLLTGTWIGLLLLSVTSSVFAQVKSPNAWAPLNFDTTVAGNYRGAKITSAAQIDSMKNVYGITTIINLAKDAISKGPESEIDWTKSRGMEYISVYLGTQPPSPKDWIVIKNAIAKGKAYIHCAHGADRTGAIIARYRVETQGVTPEAAYKEAKKYGFKPWLTDLRKWIGYE